MSRENVLDQMTERYVVTYNKVAGSVGGTRIDKSVDQLPPANPIIASL